MNNKHLAAVLVGLMSIVFLQGIVEFRKRLAKVQTELAEADTTAAGVELQLNTEKSLFTSTQNRSKPTLEYLEAWMETLTGLNTQEAAEFRIASRVKDADLVTLSQRFEIVDYENATVQRVVRANFTFEDDFAKTLNWLGKIEDEIPAIRVTNLKIVRGEGANDIRAQLTLDLPLVQAEEPEVAAP